MRPLADYATGVAEGWSSDTMARMIIHDLPRHFITLDRDAQRRVLEQAPPLTGTAWDALLAAMAEHLAELHGHPVQPWMDEPERFVDETPEQSTWWSPTWPPTLDALQPHRRPCGDQQLRLPGADPGRGRGRRAVRIGRQPPCGHRHVVQHGHRPGRFRAGSRRAGDGCGYRLLVVAGRGAPGGIRPAAQRDGPRARGRGARDLLRPAAGDARQRRDAVAGRAVQDLRRLRQRIRPGRGLRHRGPEAARRGGGRRRPYPGRDPRLGRQPGRGEPGADGPERGGSGAGDRSGAGAGRDPASAFRSPYSPLPPSSWSRRS